MLNFLFPEPTTLTMEQQHAVEDKVDRIFNYHYEIAKQTREKENQWDNMEDKAIECWIVEINLYDQCVGYESDRSKYYVCTNRQDAISYLFKHPDLVEYEKELTERLKKFNDDDIHWECYFDACFGNRFNLKINRAPLFKNIEILL